MRRERLKTIVRRITGRKNVKIVVGDTACTDGETVMIQDVDRRYPHLGQDIREALQETDAAHEAAHIKLWNREGKKLGRAPLSSKEFIEMHALPLAPDKDSEPFTCKLLNVVEDSLVDAEAALEVGQQKMDITNRFLIWNRQGATRPPITTLENMGAPGKCAAFIEAVFQFSVYGEMVEPFASPEVTQAARKAARSMELFAKGAISRRQAMTQVIDTLTTYCPPPWGTPQDYVAPRDMVMVPLSQMGKDIDDMPELDGPPVAPDESSDKRGSGIGDKAQGHALSEEQRKRTFEDPRMEALLAMMERVIKERTDKLGRGAPKWRAWSPGEVLTEPEELLRYEADAAMGVDPLRSRCVVKRTLEQHLMAAFIDSSGSVGNDLFVKLYFVMAALADKVAQARAIRFGVGQFSGGAAWVLEPTSDPMEIAALANSEPLRLFHGDTVVAEIYKILGGDFTGYETADLVVLSDGLFENGAALAASLEEACKRTGCNIKLHIVVFKKAGSVANARAAKELLPQQVRVWHLDANGVFQD